MTFINYITREEKTSIASLALRTKKRKTGAATTEEAETTVGALTTE